MLACNSIVIVYMLFVSGMFSKILFAQMYTKNCLVTPFSCVKHVFCNCTISLRHC